MSYLHFKEFFELDFHHTFIYHPFFFIGDWLAHRSLVLSAGKFGGRQKNLKECDVVIKSDTQYY